MVTQAEDAESIVGEEEAKVLEDAKAEIGKSEAVVIKAETEEEPEESPVEEKGEYKKDKEDEEEEDEKEEKVSKSHVLDVAYEAFRSAYDQVDGKTYKEKLVAIQTAFDEFGEAVKSSFAPSPQEVEQESIQELKSLIVSQTEQIRSLAQEIDILKQKGISNTPPKQQETRRSLVFDTTSLFDPAPKQGPMSIRDIVNATT